MSAEVIEETPRPARLVTLPGVYAPQHDTHLLREAVDREDIGPGTEVLDLGTGSGALALHAAQRGARVTAVDVARRAVMTARLNALILRRRITVQRSDLLSALPGRSYDLVICNPPYVPSRSAGFPATAPRAPGTRGTTAGRSSTGSATRLRLPCGRAAVC
ncbi:release factor glutamine methyltransferase [Streptomyces sp. PpalLS-921]|nr:release factor glutamine methyltransferase [Streptomyces sp. PpalLS-921]